mmetsp:Transcript_2345/g.4579  ORF Transcript_2345/g.4579 Transcript_2345/m.4579 type:complete len:609 (+) Transcript_2345:153-1979(+)
MKLSSAAVFASVWQLSIVNIFGGFDVPLASYLPKAVAHAKEKIHEAIHPAGSIPGSLKAALSGTCPNYAYTWARDQALVYTTILMEYEQSTEGSERTKLENILKNYANYTDTIYTINIGEHTLENRPWTLADAKYEMNGSMYDGHWCNPQNDGPALRAMVLIKFAKQYSIFHPNDTNYIENNIYSQDLSRGSKNPVKRDLEFLKDKWDSLNCEIWEEVSGKHFYDRLMARRAFKMGAEFAKERGDLDGSSAYGEKVGDVDNVLGQHWVQDVEAIIPTTGQKRYDDIQTVLATLHSYPEEDGCYSPTEEKAMANLLYKIKAFEGYFAINALGWFKKPQLGVAIGRYTGDVYNGICTYPEDVCPKPCNGQPWFLATNAPAEFLYRAVKSYLEAKSLTVTEINQDLFFYFGGSQDIVGKQLPLTISSETDSFKRIITGLLHGADSFLKRTAFHTDNSYQLSEQFNGHTGHLMSAGDLSWSYASLVTADAARKAVDPESLIQTFTPTDQVELEVIVTNVPAHGVGNVVTLVGNIDLLGNWDISKGIDMHWRRDINSADEWSIFIRVPRNTENIEYKAVLHPNNDFNNVTWQNHNKRLPSVESNPLDPVYNIW